MSSSSDDGNIVQSVMIPMFWRLGSVVAGLVAIVAGFLYVKQDSLLYFPEIGNIPRRPQDNPRRYRSPSEHHLPFEDHYIPCSDGVTIHAWFVTQQQQQQTPTLVFFHGNAGNIGLRLPNVVQMYAQLKCNILVVEYRGYGDSSADGKPSEAGLRLDSEAALRFLLQEKQIPPNRIFLFGRSLGGAVAFHLAHHAEHVLRQPVAGVIVENTFTSIADMVDHLMPYVAPLKGLVLRIGWNSLQIVSTLKQTPILYLAGSKDQLVPHAHMRTLYQASASFAKMHVIKGGTHNESWIQGGAKYWQAIRQFLADVQSSSQSGGMRKSSFDEAMDPDDMSSASARRSVHMGDATGSSTGGSIPLMPTHLVGMAKQAMGNSNKDIKKKE